MRRNRSWLVTAGLAASLMPLITALSGAPAGAADAGVDVIVADQTPDEIVFLEQLGPFLPAIALYPESDDVVEPEPELVTEAEPAEEPEHERYVVPEPEPEPIWEPQPWNIDRGPNWTDRVLLTYDDCMNDPERFIEVLDHATELNIGLLLFPTGNCVLMFRNHFGIDLLEVIRERGHWFGNHTISHPHLPRVGRNEIIRQISWPESNLLRPPFGNWNRQVYDAAASLGMRLVMWDLDTSDWRGHSEQHIIDFIVENAEPGDNVLMHFQHQAFTTRALTEIQKGLRERGIELCRPAPPDQRPTPVEVPENIC